MLVFGIRMEQKECERVSGILNRIVNEDGNATTVDSINHEHYL